MKKQISNVTSFVTKELSLLNKIKYLNLNIFRTRDFKPLIFQTQIIWFNKIHSLKYLRSATFGSKDKVIIKSEFVAKTQFLWGISSWFLTLSFFLQCWVKIQFIVQCTRYGLLLNKAVAKPRSVQMWVSSRLRFASQHLRIWIWTKLNNFIFLRSWQKCH